MPLPTSLPTDSTISLATDKSKEIFDTLFGLDWSSWGTGALSGAEGTSTNLMFQIFEAFNTVALAVVAMLFIITSLIAVVGSANEGSPMGKKYNAFWMPVRFVMSIAGLAPVFKGLSLFQVAILACIGWSINLGNYLYNIGNDYFLKHTGEFEVTSLASSTEFNDISSGILKSLTLQYYLKNERGINITPGSVKNWNYYNDWIGSGGEWQYYFDRDFGEIIVDCPSSVKKNKNLCDKKKEAIAQIIIELQPLAIDLANSKISPENLRQQDLHNAEQKLSQSISTAVNAYVNADQNFKTKLKDYYNSTREFGWLSAGATYWAISWINSETKSLMFSDIDFSFKMDSEKNFLADTYGLKDNSAILNRIDTFLRGGYGKKTGVAMHNPIPDKDSDTYVGDYLKHKGQLFIEKFGVPYVIELLQENDPILLLSTIGNYMIDIGLYIFSALTLASLVSVGIANAIVSFGLFTTCMPIILYGITLAFYLPAIPFIRWIAGLLSWIILIVESLIAAPLWIAAHALPEGEGFAGNHGRRGYFLLLAIIIRPVLMVTGFFVAIILINILGFVIGDIFGLFFNTTGNVVNLGIIGSISFFIILGALIITSASKIFGLITWLPDHITNWIGQQLHSLGEDSDVSSVRSAFAGSTNIISGIKPGGTPMSADKGQNEGQGGQTEPVNATYSNNLLALPPGRELPPAQTLSLQHSLR